MMPHSPPGGKDKIMFHRRLFPEPAAPFPFHVFPAVSGFKSPHGGPIAFSRAASHIFRAVRMRAILQSVRLMFSSFPVSACFPVNGTSA